MSILGDTYLFFLLHTKPWQFSCFPFFWVCFPWHSAGKLKFVFKICLFFKKRCLLSIAGELFTGISVRKYICIVNPEFLPWCTRHLEQSMAGNCFFSSYRQWWMVCGVFYFFLTPIFQALTQVWNFKPCGCLMSCLSVSGFYDVVVSPQGLTALLPKCHQTSRAVMKSLMHLIRFG